MDLEARAAELVAVALKRIASVHGLSAKIYRRLGLHSSASVIQNWRGRGVPMSHVFVVSRISGIPPEELRPDVFLNDPLRREAALRYCRVGPPPPPRAPRRYQRLTDQHKAIWLDVETYPTEEAAVSAVCAALGRSVWATTLHRRFGPRWLARWRPPAGVVVTKLDRWAIRRPQNRNISNS